MENLSSITRGTSLSFRVKVIKYDESSSVSSSIYNSNSSQQDSAFSSTPPLEYSLTMSIVLSMAPDTWTTMKKESLGRNDRDRYLLTSSKAQTTRMKTFLTRRQLNRLSPGSSHFVASSITAGMKSMTVVMLTAEKRPRRGIIRGMAIASRAADR